ncbi:unnamed protein product [Microthlaspi erraticum]|uniref:Low-temperature-induced 65 kDa protein n=1 Tax=Microthlaspi erraticum TaxID=1685480 RepID=A0A6D2LJV4_9BRAS|nr:unnamed protein product [Microthlaspi erraticum]
MDSQCQLQRTQGHHHPAKEPIRIHHPEVEEHQEKGPAKVLKKVKEKAKKIKKALTKHGHGHEHDRGEQHIPDDHDLDEEDTEEEDQELHGGEPARGKAHTRSRSPDPLKEDIVPPGTKVFPVVSSSSHSKPSEPIRGAVEPVRAHNASHGHEAPFPRPVKPSGVSGNEERRGAAATLTPHNTPLSSTEDVTRTFVPGEHESRDHHRVNMERPKGLEEDPAAPGGGTGAVGGMSNYQSKVTDPTGKGDNFFSYILELCFVVSDLLTCVASVCIAAGEIGAASALAALARKSGTGEHDQLVHGRDPREKSHGFDTKPGPEMGKHLPAGNQGSGLGKEFPARSHESDVKSGADLGRDFPARSYESDVKSGAGLGSDFQARSHDSDFKSGAGLGSDFPARRHEFDVKSGADLGKDFPGRTQGERNPEGFDSIVQERRDEMQHPNQSSYTDKIASATSVVADKAVAAKNAVASKLGYSGEGGDVGHHEGRVVGAETPGSGGVGYGSKVAGVVTPVYEKVKETGASVMTKLPFAGGGTGTETETYHGQDKGVSAKEYMSEKLSPGEEDKALSEVVAEKLHLGGGGDNTTAPPKRGTVTQSEEVEKRLGGFTDQTSGDAMKHGQAFAEGGEGGMVDKLRGAVTSWISGTTDEVMQKSTESVQDSSQSVGATVGNMGFSGSGADGAGQRSGEKKGSVPVQSRFQESGN